LLAGYGWQLSQPARLSDPWSADAPSTIGGSAKRFERAGAFRHFARNGCALAFFPAASRLLAHQQSLRFAVLRFAAAAPVQACRRFA
jgi:hypothetical protein